MTPFRPDARKCSLLSSVDRPGLMRYCQLYLSFFVLHLVSRTSHRLPVVFGDEVAYLNTARRFAAGLLPQWPDTHWLPGYSFLLTPLFLVSQDISRVYPWIQVVNGLLLSCLPVNALRLQRLLRLGGSDRSQLAIAAIAALFPGFLMRSHLAMTESLMLTASSFLMVDMAKIATTPRSLVPWGRAAATALFLSTVHGLGMAIAGSAIVWAASVGLSQLRLGVRRKAWLFGVMTVVALGVGGTYATLIFHYKLHGLTLTDFAQIYSTDVTLERCRNLVLATIGVFWYLQIATVGVAGLGFVCLFRLWRQAPTSPARVFAGFALTAFTAVLIISQLSSAIPDAAIPSVRMDSFFYGRYVEQVLLPVLTLGLGFVVGTQPAEAARSLCMSAVATFAATLVLTAYGQVLMQPKEDIAWVMVLGLQAFRLFTRDFGYDFVVFACTGLGATLLAVLAVGASRRQFLWYVASFFALTNAADYTFFKSLTPFSSAMNDVRLPLLPPLERYLSVAERPSVWLGLRERSLASIGRRYQNFAFVRADFPIDAEAEHPAQGALIIANEAPPDAVLVGYSPDDKLWLTPGVTLETFKLAGWTLPRTFPAPLPPDAFHAHLDLAMSASEGAPPSLQISLRHLGTGSFWPTPVSLSSSRFGMYASSVLYGERGEVLSHADLPLPKNVYPGQSFAFDVPLTPNFVALVQRAGTAVLRVDLFQNGVRVFSDHGVDQAGYLRLTADSVTGQITGSVAVSPELKTLLRGIADRVVYPNQHLLTGFDEPRVWSGETAAVHELALASSAWGDAILIRPRARSPLEKMAGTALVKLFLNGLEQRLVAIDDEGYHFARGQTPATVTDVTIEARTFFERAENSAIAVPRGISVAAIEFSSPAANGR